MRYASNFTFATVKGAGHMVPLHRPAAAQTMVRGYLRDRRLPGGARASAAATLAVPAATTGEGAEQGNAGRDLTFLYV